MQIEIRRARTADIKAIRALVDTYTADRRLLSKATVTLYESVQEFWVAVDAAQQRIVGCGALHVMWEDLAEIRTVAVDPAYRGQKIGHRIVTEQAPLAALDALEGLGLRREIATAVGSLRCQPASVPPVRRRSVIRARASRRSGVSK